MNEYSSRFIRLDQCDMCGHNAEVYEHLIGPDTGQLYSECTNRDCDTNWHRQRCNAPI